MILFDALPAKKFVVMPLLGGCRFGEAFSP